MKIVNRKISELIPAEYNPRQLTKEQFQDIRASINRFGIVDPIIVNTHPDRLNIIIGGHQRCKVAESIGIEEVPTVELQLTLAEESELNVRLNKNTGSFDMDALANYFDEKDLIDWGFTHGELVGFEDENVAVGEQPEGIELSDAFVVPPFSILDTRQGYWQERKKWWKEEIGSESNVEKDKGHVSDAFKRACVSWGIGRFLYRLPIQTLTTKQWKGKDYPYAPEKDKIIFDGDTLTKYINWKIKNNKI